MRQFRLALLTLGAAVIAGTGAARAAEPGSPTEPATAGRPNIVFVLADDLGWADLGCYGNRFNETPRLDRLAAESARFTHFYACGAVCSPTRASIQSGQYQARFGLTAHIPGHWRPFERLAEPPVALALPLAVQTIAERLQAVGYATGYFGKWHLGDKGTSPQDQGYREVVESGGHVIGPKRQSPPGTQPRRAAEYLAEKAAAFIEAHRDEPFFAFVSPYAVHIPLSTTAELERKYAAKPRVEGYSCHPLYAGLLEELDAAVGQLLDALDRAGVAGRTIVVFTSDNGGLEREVGGWPGTCNRPLRNEKGSLYEGGIRVPCIVRWPGLTTAGATIARPAASIDFYPTLAAAAGAAHPAVDGVDLRPLLAGRAAAERTLYWHYPHYHHSRPSGAIRAGGLKLIEFFDSGETELYDLDADPSEAKDLARARPADARHLRQRLTDWRREVDAQMPQANPAYDPARAAEWWSRRTIAPTEAPGTYRDPVAKP